MNSISSSLRREARVALSLRAQPLWFRISKWAVFLTLSAFFWRQPLFWRCVLAAAALGLFLHFFYRWKTRGWTRPWGGWNDLAAGRD
jgi:1-acyl-sn-glycerol-3-phosphate acyltransferase